MAEGPVGHGKVTCISVFGGPDIDFGLGEGKGSVLWVENIHESQDLLQEFKGWFENEDYKKVWHNYGFDRYMTPFTFSTLTLSAAQLILSAKQLTL